MTEGSKLKNLVTFAKDLFASAREAILVVVLLILLLSPGSVVSWLRNSGLSKVGLFGVNVEAREAVEQSRDETRDVAGKLEVLERRAVEAERQVAALQRDLARAATAPVPAPGPDAIAVPPQWSGLQARVENLSASLNTSRELATGARVQAARTIQKQDLALEELGKGAFATEPPPP